MLNNIVPSTSETSNTHRVPYSSERKNPQGKIRGKRKQGARFPETLKKSHNTNTEFHYKEVTITSKGYKISLCISKITIRKTILHIGQHPVKTKATGKRKKKGREKEKEKEKEKKRGNEKEREKEK